jgi:hypothetical protein
MHFNTEIAFHRKVQDCKDNLYFMAEFIKQISNPVIIIKSCSIFHNTSRDSNKVYSCLFIK